jgi:hypothetical protein
MTRDDIIRMARESCPYTSDELRGAFYDGFMKASALVAAAEREACAQSLDKQADLAADEIDRQWAQEMAAAVRARGETK